MSCGVCKVVEYIEYVDELMIDPQDHEVVMNFLLEDCTQQVNAVSADTNLNTTTQITETYLHHTKLIMTPDMQ